MGVVQRGVFGSSVWLGFMMSHDHIARAWPFAAPLLLAVLLHYAHAHFRLRDAAA